LTFAPTGEGAHPIPFGVVSESAISAFLSVLALAAAALSVSLLVSWVTGVGAGVRRELAPFALPLALAISTTATLGSLYYSEIADFPPCKLCWYQRIAMYPLPVLLFVAIVAGDRRVARYTVPLAAVGAAVAVYHIQLELFPEQASVCSADVPCTIKWVEEFGFMTIPVMALCGFAAVIALSLLARPNAPVDVEES
jgi:disulfide bond formation protein DsbB